MFGLTIEAGELSGSIVTDPGFAMHVERVGCAGVARRAHGERTGRAGCRAHRRRAKSSWTPRLIYPTEGAASAPRWPERHACRKQPGRAASALSAEGALA
jgi:hypothetical protein